MSRVITSIIFVFSISLLSFSAVGCSEGTTVIEDTRNETEINQEEEDYEKQMEGDTSEDVTQ